MFLKQLNSCHSSLSNTTQDFLVRIEENIYDKNLQKDNLFISRNKLNFPKIPVILSKSWRVPVTPE